MNLLIKKNIVISNLIKIGIQYCYEFVELQTIKVNKYQLGISSFDLIANYHRIKMSI